MIYTCRSASTTHDGQDIQHYIQQGVQSKFIKMLNKCSSTGSTYGQTYGQQRRPPPIEQDQQMFNKFNICSTGSSIHVQQRIPHKIYNSAIYQTPLPREINIHLRSYYWQRQTNCWNVFSDCM